MQNEPDLEPDGHCWRLPCPSPRAERVLLALYAMGAGDAHRVRRLAPMAREMGIDAGDLPALLAELGDLGYLHLSPGRRVARLTFAAATHVGLIAGEVLDPQVAGAWTPPEQAEALLILRPESFYADVLLP